MDELTANIKQMLQPIIDEQVAKRLKTERRNLIDSIISHLQSLQDPAEKRCATCDEFKLLEEFQVLPSGSRRKTCNTCRNKAIYDGRDKDKVKIDAKKYREKKKLQEEHAKQSVIKVSDSKVEPAPIVAKLPPNTSPTAKAIDNECKWCGKKTQKLFCSDACRKRSERIVKKSDDHKVPCGVCGKKISSGVFCSQECKETYDKKKAIVAKYENNWNADDKPPWLVKREAEEAYALEENITTGVSKRFKESARDVVRRVSKQYGKDVNKIAGPTSTAVSGVVPDLGIAPVRTGRKDDYYKLEEERQNRVIE